MLHCLPRERSLDGSSKPQLTFSMDDRAAVFRRKGWVCVLSAYTASRTPNRFIQGRQNFLSLYHQKTGLLLGGGSTKIQPLWSTVTVGKPDALSPDSATPDSDLAPTVSETGLHYVPERVSLQSLEDDNWELRIHTGGALVSLQVQDFSEHAVHLRVELLETAIEGRPVAVHLPLLPYFKDSVFLSESEEQKFSQETWTRKGITCLQHHGFELSSPELFSVTWPARADNPYTADGKSELGEARLVVRLDLQKNFLHELTLSVQESSD